MLDIIIPQYKETDEIIKFLLDSINNQINVDFKDVDDMLLSGNTTYYFSGRKASKEELEHILRLHKRLESVRKI